MSMQSGSGHRAAARQASILARCGRFSALLLGLAVAACANVGQIGNLTEGQRVTVALESVDGPSAAVVHNFVRTFKDEAQARQISVVPPREADYRLRGYVALHSDGGGASIAWAWDIYGAGERRAFRLSGEDKTGSTGATAWPADDQALRRIAQSGMQQLAVFLAAARPASPAMAEPPPPRRWSTFAWLDDWTPEASGIFRIFRRGPQPEIAADRSLDPSLAGQVPLPRGRPAPANPSSGAAFAFAPDD
jgi:hypothetical protein